MRMGENEKLNILFILPSYNIYGGTPKKTLDLLKYFREDAILYVYNNEFQEFKSLFEATGAKIIEGVHGWNIFKHFIELIWNTRRLKIDIIQTQFSMGEFLGFYLKLFRPNTKLVVAFVNSLSPKGLKKWLVNIMYYKVDTFIFISKYVRVEKLKAFPVINKKKGELIYNGTESLKASAPTFVHMNKTSLLDVAGLIECKNLNIVIEAVNILVNQRGFENIYFYIAGDGPKKDDIEKLITKYELMDHVFILGYQSNIALLLDSSDIFVHPSYSEGFGIAVAEAMQAEKPIIVAKAGALPELIDHEISGLVIDPFDPIQWADSIEKLINNSRYAALLGRNARSKALSEFSILKFVNSYNDLYKKIIQIDL